MTTDDCARCAIEADADRYDTDPGPLWHVPHTCGRDDRTVWTEDDVVLDDEPAEYDQFGHRVAPHLNDIEEVQEIMTQQPWFDANGQEVWEYDDGVVITPSPTQQELVKKLRAYNLDRAAAKLGADGDALTRPGYEAQLLQSRDHHPSNRSHR